jgi:hypothetical protein
MEKVITNKKLLLTLSSSIFLYWLLNKTIDVYQIAILGVLYEIIWLPMLVMLFVLPFRALLVSFFEVRLCCGAAALLASLRPPYFLKAISQVGIRAWTISTARHDA